MKRTVSTTVRSEKFKLKEPNLRRDSLGEVLMAAQQNRDPKKKLRRYQRKFKRARVTKAEKRTLTLIVIVTTKYKDTQRPQETTNG
ncbi:hypothetical protein Zmor_023260 [Zophobas morio]|uniref:Uncharacterized protein n=1 Tax=Zophobas morio TaxID=2755281 RepID=A0AA38HYF4_9CUCU|nr:hypothetical protein Zmor_023260 [Zophobas morio]